MPMRTWLDNSCELDGCYTGWHNKARENVTFGCCPGGIDSDLQPSYALTLVRDSYSINKHRHVETLPEDIVPSVNFDCLLSH
jgi:hypothetical protein